MSAGDPLPPMRPVGSQPAVVIVLGIEEGRPRITTTARGEAEVARVADWVRSQPNLNALLQAALELERGGCMRHVTAENLEATLAELEASGEELSAGETWFVDARPDDDGGDAA